MILETRAAPPFMKNGYVLGCPRTRAAVVIDPGDEVAGLIAVVRELDLSVEQILLTHAHIDHISGVAAAKAAFQAPVHLHRDDLFLYEHVVDQGAMFGLSVEPQPPIDVFYDDSVVKFGDFEVRVHHTPGHCPGEVCLEVCSGNEPGTSLFVGDSLFAGSIGRTDLPGGNYGVLMRSIVDVIFPLGDEAVVYPGHGPKTTVRRERERNPFVLEYLSGLGR
jgi:glyoxylase-like metal-dependent hydrolase (beta-lactamase superfamily II)